MILKKLQQAQQMVNKINSDCYQSIMKSCNENEDINEFVRLVLAQRDERNPDETAITDERIGNNLIALVYHLGYDIQINPYHSASFLYELDSFMGNFFFDDSYFEIVDSEFKGEKKAIASYSNNCTQDPKVLIQCAIENIKAQNKKREYYNSIKIKLAHQNLNRVEGGECAPRYPWHPTEDDYKAGGEE